MKQIVIVTSDRLKYEELIDKNVFYVTWCSFMMADITRLRDRSTFFLLCIDGEDPKILRKVGLYLRDLCLEEEKYIYLYGEKTGVDIIKKLVPSLFVRKTGYFHDTSLEKVMDAIESEDSRNNTAKPGILIIDDDIAYIGKLRLFLEPYFSVFVSHQNLPEAGNMLYFCDIVIMSTKCRFTVIDMVDFFKAARKKKLSTGLMVYYLTDDITEQDRLNNEAGDGGIAFLRSVDVSRVAGYFINKHSQNNVFLSNRQSMSPINNRTIF